MLSAIFTGDFHIFQMVEVCSLHAFSLFIYVCVLCSPRMSSINYVIYCDLLYNFVSWWSSLMSDIYHSNGVRWWGILRRLTSCAFTSVDLWKRLRAGKKGVAVPGLEPRAFGFLCQCSATELWLPPATTPQSCHYVYMWSALGMVSRT